MTPPAAATAAARSAPTRVRPPGPGTRIPRRVSGPAPTPKLAPPTPRLRRAKRRVLAEFLATLPDRAIVERTIRGRWWIGTLAILLFGLVALQVRLLALNAGIGSAVERTAALERGNGELRAQVSKLSSGERIQRKARQIGMVLPPAGEITFVSPAEADAGAAAAAVREGRFGDGAAAVAAPVEDEAGDEEAVDPLNDGDPSNDYLHDGDPTNDAGPAPQAASDPLNDGDPSNDHPHGGAEG